MKAILTYHSIDDSRSPISVDADAFERHVEFLSSGTVDVVPLAEIEDARDRSIALTFDDAFENFDTDAWPLLRDAGLPVTLFVVTGQVGGDNAWGGKSHPSVPTLPLLDWERLGRLAEEGVELGAHSRTHASLPTVDATRLRDEMEGSRDDLAARTGTTPTSFAYPYGAISAEVGDLAAELFDHAVTTELDHLRGDERPHLLPRLDAYYLRERDVLEGFGSAGFAIRISTRRMARRARSALRPWGGGGVS